VDEVVVFHPLSRDHLMRIVSLELDAVQRRLDERHIVLDVSDGAKALLGREGYDPVYGARPVRRVVQREVENPLARRIIAGEVRDGDTVHLEAAGAGGLTMRREARPDAARSRPASDGDVVPPETPETPETPGAPEAPEAPVTAQGV
jgi:ATP-dependent Clp protease ATP-binding subunit ClpB